MTDLANTDRPADAPLEKGLKSDAVSLVSNIVIGVASTAPAYSLAATLGLIVVAVGVLSPVIVVLAFVFGFFTSTQYTSMNTLAYADVSAEQASGATPIASTVQQLAVSFGVATASLAAAVFIPNPNRASAPELIYGIHLALRVLGGLTIVSTIVFSELKPSDGDAVSSHKAEIPAG